MEQEEVQEKAEEPRGKRPWQVLNERDKGEIVTHFLHGLSPSQIATLTKRSLPFVYEVLQSEDAQDTIQRFERERENGLMEVGERLQRSTVTLLDGLLEIALRGKKEANQLNAIKHGLALAGLSPVQKVATVSAKVVIHQDKLDRARETIEWEEERRGGGNGNGDSILDKLAGALNATGPGRAICIDLSAGGAAPAGVAAKVPEKYVLPGEGGTWIRSADKIPSLADLRDAAKQEAEKEVDSVATGPLQEHDGNEDVSTMAADQQPADENPYYQRDSDERPEVHH